MNLSVVQDSDKASKLPVDSNTLCLSERARGNFIDPGVLERGHVRHLEMCLSVAYLSCSLLKRDGKGPVITDPVWM